MLDKDAIAPWTSETTDVRTALHKSRHRFEMAADALRDDIASLQRLTRWKDVIRNRPMTSLGIGLAAGLAVGALIARSRR